jgi:small subunit ribosomal protein S3e
VRTLTISRRQQQQQQKMATSQHVNKKRKFVADGVFFSELSELLGRELHDEGFSGVEVRNTPTRTEIIIRATRTKAVLGEKGQRIRELTSAVQKRFGFREGTVELYAERVMYRGLCAMAQAESLKYKLIEGLAACVLRRGALHHGERRARLPGQRGRQAAQPAR